MAIEQKEVYVVMLKDGSGVNAVASSFAECINLYGEENIVKIEKVGEPPKEA